MEHTIDVNWKQNMTFETEINGHKLIIDTPEAMGGNDRGPRPKPLMIVALAGCTGLDVVSILNKMRVPLDGFNVKVKSVLTDEDPKHYKSMHIVYEFWGHNLPMDKLTKAVELSQERYCGVSYMYKKIMEVTYEVVIR